MEAYKCEKFLAGGITTELYVRLIEPYQWGLFKKHSEFLFETGLISDVEFNKRINAIMCWENNRKLKN